MGKRFLREFLKLFDILKVSYKVRGRKMSKTVRKKPKKWGVRDPNFAPMLKRKSGPHKDRRRALQNEVDLDDGYFDYFDDFDDRSLQKQGSFDDYEFDTVCNNDD